VVSIRSPKNEVISHYVHLKARIHLPGPQPLSHRLSQRIYVLHPMSPDHHSTPPPNAANADQKSRLATAVTATTPKCDRAAAAHTPSPRRLESEPETFKHCHSHMLDVATPQARRYRHSHMLDVAATLRARRSRIRALSSERGYSAERPRLCSGSHQDWLVAPERPEVSFFRRAARERERAARRERARDPEDQRSCAQRGQRSATAPQRLATGEEASPPTPPLVLSGHAASLTPY
jgi:hypothetical protein